MMILECYCVYIVWKAASIYIQMFFRMIQKRACKRSSLHDRIAQREMKVTCLTKLLHTVTDNNKAQVA